jgi:hypothetical protein
MESGQGGSVEDVIAISSSPRSRQQVKAKLTLWRPTNACFLLGVATAKAILAYRNNSSVNSLDMALGLVWAFV